MSDGYKMSKAHWAIMKRRNGMRAITSAGRIKAESRACVTEREEPETNVSQYGDETSSIRKPD